MAAVHKLLRSLGLENRATIVAQLSELRIVAQLSELCDRRQTRTGAGLPFDAGYLLRGSGYLGWRF